jgi:hypothetical protein
MDEPRELATLVHPAGDRRVYAIVRHPQVVVEEPEPASFGGFGIG